MSYQSFVRRALLSAKSRVSRHLIEPRVRRQLSGQLFEPTARETIEATVSLTSYRPRFPTLHLTLRSLLAQTLRPRKIVVWLDIDQIGDLPTECRRLTENGISFEPVTRMGLGSYKKLIPALLANPADTYVICDDDTYYPPDWLQSLWEARGERTVVCSRAHLISLRPNGQPKPYVQWTFGTGETRHKLLFPTGTGGVLYPEGIFDRRVTDIDTLLDIAPNADDIWFYWMAALNGARFTRIRTNAPLVVWGGSQQVSLWKRNKSRNDVTVAAMFGRFGAPWPINDEAVPMAAQP